MVNRERFVVTEAFLPKRKRAILNKWKDKEQLEEEAKQAKADGQVQSRGATRPYDKPISYLRREIYRMVRSCLRTGGMSFLEAAYAESLKNQKKGAAVRPTLENEKNPFYMGIVYVTAGEPRFTRNYRVRFARELLYAQLHDVPPDLLIGFLYQIGSSDEISNRLKKRLFEDWRGKLPRSDTSSELKRIKHPLAVTSSKPRTSKKRSAK